MGKKTTLMFDNFSCKAGSWEDTLSINNKIFLPVLKSHLFRVARRAIIISLFIQALVLE